MNYIRAPFIVHMIADRKREDRERERERNRADKFVQSIRNRSIKCASEKKSVIECTYVDCGRTSRPRLIMYIINDESEG